MANGANGERDERGRFTNGNAGGPGNPYGRRVAELRTALLDAVTSEDVAAMARAMIDKAREGDAVAFRVLAPYLFGKPPAESGDAAEQPSFSADALAVLARLGPCDPVVVFIDREKQRAGIMEELSTRGVFPRDEQDAAL